MGIKVGLTGNIASGKSALADLLAARGWTAIDTDQIARRVVQPGTEGLAAIVEAFGEEMLTPDGALDREKLGQRVFNDDAARATLNAITHPRIGQAMLADMAAAPGNVVVSVPLLFEAKMEDLFDEIWVVVCDKDTQLSRLLARDGMTEAHARARMASQWPVDRKVAAAAEVFYNNGTLKDLELALEERLAARGL